MVKGGKERVKDFTTHLKVRHCLRELLCSSCTPLKHQTRLCEEHHVLWISSAESRAQQPSLLAHCPLGMLAPSWNSKDLLLEVALISGTTSSSCQVHAMDAQEYDFGGIRRRGYKTSLCTHSAVPSLHPHQFNGKIDWMYLIQNA